VSGTPPKTPPKNTRRHPRFELFASVELHSGDETVVLPARNLSLGGVSLAADGHDLGRFEVGSIIDVLIFDAVDESTAPVRSPARVLRHDADSMALMWNATDPHVAELLASLLHKLQPRRK
jgi:PilZ domain